MRSSTYTDRPLLAGTAILIFFLVICFAVFPAATNKLAEVLFYQITRILGTPLQVLTFAIVLLLIFLASSKYGNIRLGNEKPEYSTFSWISMMTCCGISSAMLFWAFTDWAYDFETRSGLTFLGVSSPYEIGTAFTFFHWGISTWAIYCVSALPIAYYFYVKRNKGLSLSAICLSAFAGRGGPMARRAVSGIIDVLFLFTCCTGISVALGLSVPMLTRLIALMFGLPVSFGLDLTVILLISAVFTISSYLGLASGMQTLSRLCVRLVIIFVLLVFICGPTLFLMKSTVNATGLALQNFVRLSLWTDPVTDCGLPEKWTVWYWLYDWSFTPFVGLFVAKISKGRSVRGVIVSMLVGGTLGLFVVFGVLSHYSVSAELKGLVDVTELVNSGQMSLAVVDVLQTLPIPWLFSIIFGLAAVLLLVTSLDSAAYTMSATLTRNLAANGHPHRHLRMVCCLLLISVPITMLLGSASLETLKTCAIISGVPLCVVLCSLIYAFIRTMLNDFGHMSGEAIRSFNAAGESAVNNASHESFSES